MSSATKAASDFTVVELRDKLKVLGLSMSGSKNDLITRLMEADPSGNWRLESATETVENTAYRETDNGASAGGPSAATSELAFLRREMELTAREKQVMQRELEIARREIEILRDVQRLSIDSREQTPARNSSPRMCDASPRMNTMAVADLLNYFDGNSDTFAVWIKQVEFLRSTYKLSDGELRTIIGSRMKGNAFEWLHSNPEYVRMCIDDFLRELEDMYYHPPSKITSRRQFEDRVWKSSEKFSEYMHAKSIMANRISIKDDELVDYIIEGIPDAVLRNQAHVQRLKTKSSLLEAFAKVELRGKQHASGTRPGTDDEMFRPQKNKRYGNRADAKIIKRCFNCGSQNHYGAECPVKHKGTKCFECREFGHLAAKCPKKNNLVKDSCNLVRSIGDKCKKDVEIGGRKVTALIDTGSDLSLMRADQYILLGSPKLSHREVKFRGIGSEDIETLGELCTEIEIDGECYPLTVHIISDVLMRHALLLGTDFLNKIEMTMKAGSVSICKPSTLKSAECDVPEIYRIDCISDNSEIDLSHIPNFEHRSKVRKLIDDYNPVKTREVGVKMNLLLKDEQPVYQRARRLSPSEREEVNAHVDDLLRRNIIQPSLSEYASPIVLVKKKNGTTRLCVDYRQLNNKVIKDRYPLPLIDDQLDALQGANVFSTLDLENGFFHVPLDKESRKYTAFITPDGHYEFLYVPFGLCNSPAVFQKFINAVFKDVIDGKTVLTYMDDLIIPTIDRETGLRNLERVLQTAQQFGLKINWQKCSFLCTETEFLGHIIKNGSIGPSQRKTEAVMKFPQPTTVRQIQQFLGLTGYFRKFIRDYSLIARPLTNLLRSEVKFKFDEKEKFAFEQLKVALINKPVLKIYKVNAETELHTDASMFGYGAMLLQKDSEDGVLHPVYFASGKTTATEEKYTSYELEVLAVIKALRKFRVYLLGVPFKIVTDCRAFALTMNKKDLCIRVARWALQLEEFQYNIEHRAGNRMSHVDALSRNPLPCSLVVDESEDCVTARIKKAQLEDGDLKKILDASEQKRIDGYVVRGGLLFKEVGADIRLVVPRSIQTQLIRRAHENGHFSASKTETLLKRDYWFPNMRSRVEKTVRNCIDCILAERKHGKQEGLLHSIEKGEVPLDTYHIDHLGPLPSSKKNYCHIFVVVDAFTKFVWLYATKTTNTSEVLDRLGKQAAIFGNPRRIISDRGTAFTSHNFEEYCQQEGIKHVLITTGIPRANGQVERVNRTIIPMLTKLSAPKPEEWFRYLEICQRYLNMMTSRSTRTSPFKLLFGIEMRLKSDPRIMELIESELTTAFQNERDELRLQAKARIQKIQEENRSSFNKRRKEAERYKENDLVAIKRTQLGPGLKFAPKYLGPYVVIRVLRNDRYMVQKIGEHEGPLQTSTAADHMKPWISDDSSEEEEDDNI